MGIRPCRFSSMIRLTMELEEKSFGNKSGEEAKCLGNILNNSTVVEEYMFLFFREETEVRLKVIKVF